MNTPYTGGEWVLMTVNAAIVVAATRQSSDQPLYRRIATVYRTTSEWPANAKLLAAAPAMVKLLLKARATIVAMCPRCDEDGYIDRDDADSVARLYHCPHHAEDVEEIDDLLAKIGVTP